MYAVSAETAGVACKTVPLTADFQLNLAEIKPQLEGVKVVFVCSPNNPTGNLLKRSDLLELLQLTAGKAIVVVDEAYIEFCPEATLTKRAEKLPALSHYSYPLQSLCLGRIALRFCVSQYGVNPNSQQSDRPLLHSRAKRDIAEQALQAENIALVQARAQEILANRQWLAEALADLPQVENVYHSEANYLLIKCQDGERVFKALWEQGIILRDQNKALNLQNCIRITVGTKEECESVVGSIGQI